MAITSLTRCATEAAASLPSTVIQVGCMRVLVKRGAESAGRETVQTEGQAWCGRSTRAGRGFLPYGRAPAREIPASAGNSAPRRANEGRSARVTYGTRLALRASRSHGRLY